MTQLGRVQKCCHRKGREGLKRGSGAFVGQVIKLYNVEQKALPYATAIALLKLSRAAGGQRERWKKDLG